MQAQAPPCHGHGWPTPALPLGRLPGATERTMLRKMARSGETDFDVAVVGGGAAGLAAALIAATAGFPTVLFAPSAAIAPARTAALLVGSIEIRSEIDVWPALASHA